MSERLFWFITTIGSDGKIPWVLAVIGIAVERTPFDTWAGKTVPGLAKVETLPNRTRGRPKENYRKKFYPDIDSDSLFEMPLKRV